MIKIGICDDEKNIVDRIESYINNYKDKTFNIITYNSGEELLKEKRYLDVIFLDIDMPKINGIETAKFIRKYDKNVKIIYVTSFTEYVNLAFGVHAFGYLNKPINEEDIHKQLDEVISYLNEKKEEEFIEFVTTEGVLRLRPKDIYYFEYTNRKVNIKTKDKVYVLKERITKIAETMSKYNFLMPHKSFTVNLFYVKSIKGYDIFMMDGNIIPLSQKKSVEFREKLNIFLENCILF